MDYVNDAGDEAEEIKQEADPICYVEQQWNEIDWEDIYYQCKENVKYFLEDMKFSASFDDMIMAMTLFVLFADPIRLLAAHKDDDFGFVWLTVSGCSRSLRSLSPRLKYDHLGVTTNLRYKGFFNSFIGIRPLSSKYVPRHQLIANGMSIGNLSESWAATVAFYRQDLRLMRLVRLVRLYKIFTEKRKRMKIEKELWNKCVRV